MQPKIKDCEYSAGMARKIWGSDGNCFRRYEAASKGGNFLMPAVVKGIQEF